MKNLKISAKLFITFGIILVMLMGSAAMAISGLLIVGNSFDSFYEESYATSNRSMKMRRDIQATGKDIMYAIVSDTEKQSKEFIDSAKADLASLKEDIEFLRTSFTGDMDLVEKLYSTLTNVADVKEEIYELAGSLQNDKALDLYWNQYYPALIEANGYLMQVNEAASEAADQTFVSAQTTKWISFGILIGIVAAALIITVIMAIYIIRSLTRPIMQIEQAAVKMASGDLSAAIPYQSKDELGNLAEKMRQLVNMIKTIIADEDHLLGQMADGNFDVHSKAREYYIGDFQPLLTSLHNINSRLSGALSQINQSADQVSSGSDQVSSGAQALSQGATEQASSVQELAATINEISEQVKNNAKNAQEASAAAQSVGTEMAESNKQMEDMMSAMEEISESSGEIGKIIKTIEDIAFQTNILALNAAVEAARAGAAGKGFAVVADEVRNLASKSSEASKNTAALIEGSIRSVENGTKIADATAKSLMQAVEGANGVVALIEKISHASNEQASSLTQVTQGVDQISSVVQTNSATAEQSAAASEELSGQAQVLKQLVSQFHLSNQAIENDVGFDAFTTSPEEFSDAPYSNGGKY